MAIPIEEKPISKPVSSPIRDSVIPEVEQATNNDPSHPSQMEELEKEEEDINIDEELGRL